MSALAHDRAADLDERILDAVARWHRAGQSLDEADFERLALDLCAYQLARNVPYARYAASLGVTAASPPGSWRAIPAVPASAFRDSTLATFDARLAEAEFHTSGTTAARSGKHYLERLALYDAALLAGFDRFMLPDAPRMRFLNLVPNPRTHPHSSLGYMMGHVSVLRGDGGAGWFLVERSQEPGEFALDAEGFVRALDAAIAQGQPVCIAGTAFAFVALLDALAVRDRTFASPAGSRIMETGGFKGRSRTVERDELYAGLARALGIAPDAIVAEYGMTELSSQFYDAPSSRSSSPRVKAAPPWLRTRVVDAAGRDVAPGETGSLVHVDLANRSSCIAVRTEDRGYVHREGFVLLGREIDAPPRGCSLDAEDLP